LVYLVIDEKKKIFDFLRFIWLFLARSLPLLGTLRTNVPHFFLVDLTLKILTEEGKPLHVNEIALLLQQRCGRLTDRDALSSALAKKSRQGILLRQSAPATFTLIEAKEDHQATT
jgi:hypothetical protein